MIAEERVAVGLPARSDAAVMERPADPWQQPVVRRARQGRYAIYGEASAQTPLASFGDSYGFNGTAGFRMTF